MATLQKIRTQGGLLVAIVIGLALVAFILGDLFQSGSSIFTRGRMEIGSIKGETVQYPDFQRKVEELAEIYRSNTGQSQLNEDTWVQVRDQTWETMVREKIMGDVYEKLGITVSQDEMFDMLQGNNIHPIVQQIFTNPNTGQFERSAVVNFIRNLETGVSPEQRNYWLYLENQILNERMQAKYNSMISKALYVTNDEAQFSLEGKNRNVSFEYIALSYNTLPDSAVKATDKELRAYYDANEDEFKEDNTRQIEYIAFEVVPSPSDFSASEKWINDIRTDFAGATDNVQFVTSNSDVGFDGIWHTKATLPANLATWVFDEAANVNDVFGPYFENNSYKLAKLHASEMMPDSVEARHILLRVNTPEEAASAQALADSLKGVVDKGGDFASLARQYSTDTGSAINGGDLGWFRRGMMVKPFEDAAFNNQVNQVTVVASQFGIHIVQTTRRGALNRQVQVAVLERTVTPSTLTYQSIYGKASKFVTENTTREKFDAAATAENLPKKQATLLENDRTIVGLESPRALVRAAFDAEPGEILKNFDGSPIFELGSNFVVGVLLNATEEGPAPFDQVKSRVELAVLKQKKGDLLAERMAKAAEGKSDMYEIATAVGGSVNIASNINLTSVTLPGMGTEPSVIGTVTALEPGTMTTPLKGNNAVFLAKITNVEDGGDTNLEGEKTRLLQALSFRASYEAFEAHRSAVEVVDKRNRFF